MKRPTLLYIPLALMFLFAAAAFVAHYAEAFKRYETAAATAKLPFAVTDGAINSIDSEAEAAGLQRGDRIVELNGREMNSNEAYFEELAKLKPGDEFTLKVSRRDAEGQVQFHPLTLTAKEISQDINYSSKLIVGAIYAYILPTVCALLGFWVVFMRPRDYLAWLLLFLLLGMSS